jgi:nitrogen regulatory protein PII
MKEIKAYIRRDCLNQAVDELEKAGAPGITLVEIHPVGYGYEPNYFENRFEDAFRRYGYLRIVKLEVVCRDKDSDRLVEVIRRVAHTGTEEDGIIFVVPVIEAIRIRDGESGEKALAERLPPGAM